MSQPDIAAEILAAVQAELQRPNEITSGTLMEQDPKLSRHAAIRILERQLKLGLVTRRWGITEKGKRAWLYKRVDPAPQI